jgi:hypothetical protein
MVNIEIGPDRKKREGGRERERMMTVLVAF